MLTISQAAWKQDIDLDPEMDAICSGTENLGPPEENADLQTGIIIRFNLTIALMFIYGSVMQAPNRGLPLPHPASGHLR